MSERIDLAALAILARDWSEPSVTGHELGTLVAVARAALKAGPWPLYDMDLSANRLRCSHCGEWDQSEDDPTVVHDPDCTGIALRDALAGITEGGNE